MTHSDDAYVLDAAEEADRLWRGALAALERAHAGFLPLSEALELGIRSAQLYLGLRLLPVANQLPATIQSLLEPPPLEVDPLRDALYLPRSLSFVDGLDMLSAEGLECVAPGLHHGWEDRRFSCSRSRRVAREATGITLDGPTRTALLWLAAYRNRIFQLPPPLRVDSARIVAALPKLTTLVEALAVPVAVEA
jgi:hypothetical protein